MFNLVVAVIAIALVVILATAGMYYGGDAYETNQTDAEAGTLRNEQEQINGAIQVYVSEGNVVDEAFELEDLVEMNYLKDIPDGWIASDGRAVKPFDSEDPGAENVCYTANAQSNFYFDPTDENVIPYSVDPNYGIPTCDKEDLDPLTPCCVTVASGGTEEPQS